MTRTDDDDPTLIEINDTQLAIIVGRVIAEEIGTMTRAAINHALGRLD
jgi:hypothetical protein